MASETPRRPYCRKCRDALAHFYAHSRVSESDWQDITAVAIGHGTYKCECRRCGHKWASRSLAAARLAGVTA